MSNTKPQEHREARAETSPAVDILESADEIRVIADLPGARREDIELSLERGQLVLVAKRQLAREGEALATARHEGDFRRAFRVPEEIEADEITASLDHGVLQIRLPKARRAQRRRIAVEAVA
jgi:HSP20 family protein